MFDEFLLNLLCVLCCGKNRQDPNSNSNKKLDIYKLFLVKWFLFFPTHFPHEFSYSQLYSLYYVFCLMRKCGSMFSSFFLSSWPQHSTTTNNKIKVTAADIKWKHINKKMVFQVCVVVVMVEMILTRFIIP